jgi:hypothetical protein
MSPTVRRVIATSCSPDAKFGPNHFATTAREPIPAIGLLVHRRQMIIEISSGWWASRRPVTVTYLNNQARIFQPQPNLDKRYILVLHVGPARVRARDTRGFHCARNKFPSHSFGGTLDLRQPVTGRISGSEPENIHRRFRRNQHQPNGPRTRGRVSVVAGIQGTASSHHARRRSAVATCGI